jgi:flagellar hook-associated protein 2
MDFLPPCSGVTANFMEERRGRLMAGISSVYDYYMSTYGNEIRSQSRYDTHKKSELRDTYNKIVKSNKESPLVKINTDDVDLQKFAIDLKESARDVNAIVSSLSSETEGIESMLHKKIAQSSDESVGAEYIGPDSGVESDKPYKPFTIGVKSLATPQINTGHFLKPDGRNFESGNISFDLYTPNNSYEFQLTVDSGDTNLDVQNKILRLVNTSDIGLSAQILENSLGKTALQLQSKQTGLADGEEYLFNLQSSKSWNELNRLGIHNVSQSASNSSFTLNGKEHSSLSNTFTINKEFEITLKAPTTGEDATIGFKSSTEAIADGANQMIRVYNSMLQTAQKYSNGHSNSRLFSEVDGIGNTMSAEFEAIGITREGDGTLSIDKDTMAEALEDGNRIQAISSLNKFKNMLARQADRVSVNPIKYLDALIVEYKNPGKTFSAPYTQSAYSGMMIDKSM